MRLSIRTITKVTRFGPAHLIPNATMLTPETRIIFVEGIPGSGKSTVAQKLSFHLQSCGYKSRWHHENDRNHPAIRVGTSAEWDFRNIERRLRDWERFI